MTGWMETETRSIVVTTLVIEVGLEDETAGGRDKDARSAQNLYACYRSQGCSVARRRAWAIACVRGPLVRPDSTTGTGTGTGAGTRYPGRYRVPTLSRTAVPCTHGSSLFHFLSPHNHGSKK